MVGMLGDALHRHHSDSPIPPSADYLGCGLFNTIMVIGLLVWAVSYSAIGHAIGDWGVCASNKFSGFVLGAGARSVFVASMSLVGIAAWYSH